MKKICIFLIAMFSGISCFSQTGADAKVTAACSLGTGWTQVPSLPYTSAALTTCGQVDDIKTTNPVICGSSSYYGGEDVVYSFTPTVSGPMGVNVTSAGSWVGLMIYTGCPVSATAVCIANAQSSAGNQSVCINVTAGTVYFAIIDSWPAPTCNPYQINISGCSGGPTGGTATATPSLACGTYTTALSLNGSSSTCGITYQWQSGPSSTGPWTNIAGATASSTVVTVTATTYYRCILACASSTAASAPATASLSAAGACGICGVTNITVPYSITGQTTCGAGDDVTATNVTNICGSSSYYGGEDAVYAFTATATGQLGINVSSTGSWMGAMLYQGCPVSGGTCVGNAQSSAGNQSLCVNVTAGQVYYLVLDSWPSPTCNPYDLSITGCSGAPPTGTVVASPNIRCSAYTTTLSLNGVVSCGYSFQWQSGPSSTGPWTNMAGATANTATANVTSNTFYRCIVSCGSFSAASAVAGTTITPSGMCGLCGVTPITLPYSASGVTTCGAGDDLTAAMVTNACGSTSYLGGEDVIYTFTPSTSGQITITYSTSGSSAGLMLYQGCPNSGGTCAGNLQGISSFSGNQSLCLNVTAGQPYFLVVDSWPTPTCNGYNITISTPTGATPACSLGNYTASSITYSFDTFTGTSVANTDDILFNNIAMFGFNFCYTGVSYAGGYIASNGAFVFDAVPCFPNVYFNQYAAPGINTGWSITGPAPSQVSGTNSLPQNAVNAPWQDINPALGGVIRYGTLGTSPNRRFVVSWENIPMFSCGTSSPTTYYTGQVKLFETSNNIEIHVGQKRLCPGWNNGQAIMGLTSYDGLTYVPPVNATAHNATALSPYNQWIMTNSAYRFTAPCAASGPCIVLPVEFKTFYGERKDRINYLYWETAMEENIKTYIVERSADAENFTELAKVTPNNKPSHYEYDDISAAPGTLNYYRITSVDNDGERKSTNIVILGAGDGEIAVSGIYPNPVKTDLTMSIESKVITTVTIAIYDAFGKRVKTFSQDIGTGVSQLNVNCEDVPAGIYMVEAINSSKTVVLKQKMVKAN